MTSRPWLSPGLSYAERLKRAAVWAATQGWEIREWRLPLSMVHPWSRRIYLAQEDSLPHECGHVRRIEQQGRWRWLGKYAGGVVAALALIPLGAALPFWLWCLCVLGAGMVWSWSENFRREEEMWGFAEGLAFRISAGRAGPGDYQTPLGRYRLPYLVGGDPEEIEAEVYRRSGGIIQEEAAAGISARLPVSPSPR